MRSAAATRKAAALAVVAVCACSAVSRGPERMNSGAVLPAGLPFSEAVRSGDTVYLSGQIGVTPGTSTLVEGGFQAQARQTMENIRAILDAHGLQMRDLVKCTVMLEDMADWPRFNELYAGYFDGDYPARSAFGTEGLALGALVEVECIADASDGPRTK